MRRGSWTVDAFETDAGDSPAWSFIRGLEGRDRAEAIALVYRAVDAVERMHAWASTGARFPALVRAEADELGRALLAEARGLHVIKSSKGEAAPASSFQE